MAPDVQLVHSAVCEGQPKVGSIPAAPPSYLTNNHLTRASAILADAIARGAGASDHLTGPEKADLLRKIMGLLALGALVCGAKVAAAPGPAPRDAVVANSLPGVGR